jgi:hypothetical protein
VKSKRAKPASSSAAKAKKPRRPPQAQEPLVEDDEPQAEALPSGHVIERPDGFYWESEGKLNGPFATLAEAEADLLSGGAAESADPDALPEAESDLGINEWIDPDTGGPAEDSVPRLEDH